MSKNQFQVFTDGSEQRYGVGAGVYISQLGVNMCFKLPKECSILQAEIMAILKAVKWLRYHKIYGKDIMLITHIKTAIKSIGTGTCNGNIISQSERGTYRDILRSSS